MITKLLKCLLLRSVVERFSVESVIAIIMKSSTLLDSNRGYTGVLLDLHLIG